MQKLWLKNFEFHINPATWNTAQDLIQRGSVKNLREIEKHFWVAVVEDGEFVFEVETMITPHKIKAFTCECWTEGRRLMCPHIAATLYKIRQFLEQKAQARQAQNNARQQEEIGRLTVQTALKNATFEELDAFVRDYARRDRDFALALKTWFAASIEGAENTYALLLDAALPRQVGARELREPEWRRLRKTLDELDTQVLKANEIGHSHTVYQITAAILQKLSALVPAFDDARREQAVQYCRSAYQRLTQLPAEQLSPELREMRRTFLFDYFAHQQHPKELERDLLLFFGQAAVDDAVYAKIRDLFDRTPFPAPPSVLHLFLVALSRRGMPAAVERVLADYILFPQQVKDAIVTMYYLHEWAAVMQAGDTFLANGLFNAGQRREIEDLLLMAAEKSKDVPRQRAYLRQRYRQYGHPDVLQRLIGLSGADWPGESARLRAELAPDGNPERLAPFFVAEGDWQALSNLLEQHPDLHFLRLFEDYLLPDRADFIHDRYVALLAGYLHDHFGRQASAHVRDQLAGLLRKGHVELTKSIILTLVARFADRHTLPEELAELFPKSKRPAGVPHL